MKLGTVVNYRNEPHKYVGPRTLESRSESILRLVGNPPIVYMLKRLSDGHISSVAGSIFTKLQPAQQSLHSDALPLASTAPENQPGKAPVS